MDSCGTIDVYSFKPFKFELVEPVSTCVLPVARSGHRIICTSKYLYVFGGYNPCFRDSMAMKDLWKFNLATRKWKQCVKDQDFPVAVASVAAVRKKQQLLVYGGTGIPFGFTCSNELRSFKLNDETRGFSTVNIIGRPPQPMYGQAIVLHNSILYTVGGTTGFTYTCDVYRANLRKERKVWKKLYPVERNETEHNGKYVPEGRYRHEVGFDGKNIYVLGGGTAEESYSLTDIPTFNIESESWQNLKSKGDQKSDPPFPQARKCHGVVQLKTENDTYVFVMGGYQNCQMAFNDLWRLELSTLQWTLMQSPILPRSIFFHSTTLTREGKMCVFGGIQEGLEMKRTNDVYTAWICIPQLSEMCWEALLHYSQHVNLSKETLTGLKVPERFIDRID